MAYPAFRVFLSPNIAAAQNPPDRRKTRDLPIPGPEAPRRLKSGRPERVGHRIGPYQHQPSVSAADVYQEFKWL